MVNLATDLASSGGGGGSGVANFYGTYATLPAAGTAGRAAYVTDAPVATWVDDGAAWRPLINGVVATAPPLVASLTWFNQGGAVATQLNGAVGMVGINDGASPGQQRGLVAANAAATAYAELGVVFGPQFDQVAGHTASTSCILRESATGKIYNLNTFQNLANLRTDIEVEVWTSSTVRSVATPKGYAVWDGAKPLFTRVRRSAGNVIAEVSRDLQTWTAYDTRAAPFTTAPDQAGFSCAGVNAVPAFNVLHFVSGA